RAVDLLRPEDRGRETFVARFLPVCDIYSANLARSGGKNNEKSYRIGHCTCVVCLFAARTRLATCTGKAADLARQRPGHGRSSGNDKKCRGTAVFQSRTRVYVRIQSCRRDKFLQARG